MSGPTKIEWADAVWNPVTGCTKVSEGCRNCYAERMAIRLAGRARYPANNPFAVTLHPERLQEPLHWSKPRRIFVCSMGDLFHPEVPDEFIYDVFCVMARSEGHTFQVLTKRPERMNEFCQRIRYIPIKDLVHLDAPGVSYWPGDPECSDARPLPNVWLGTSVEDQATADERIPHLLRCPAAVRFVSYEPALGPVDFRWGGKSEPDYAPLRPLPLLDWVIAGSESGPRARPAHPDWFRSVRDQCQAASVPFFFKGWGDWVVLNATVREMDFVPKHKTGRQHLFDDGPMVVRLGKKAAGRMLDGVEHDGYPREGGS